MTYPDFFNQAPTITLKDDLADFLGAMEDGVITYTFLDAIKLAGHSCPTVAGAYLMAVKGIQALFKDQIPIRGKIEVIFRDSPTEGVAGVIANVISLITGSTEDRGFKGIAGNFDRRNLLHFNKEINSNVRFVNKDKNEFVDVYYNPYIYPPAEEQSDLLTKIIYKQATKDEEKRFKSLWQDRVSKILLSNDDSGVIKIVRG